jgi:hypothetical protein
MGMRLKHVCAAAVPGWLFLAVATTPALGRAQHSTVADADSLAAGDMYYELSVSGIEDYCAEAPHVCELPNVRAELEGLQTKRLVRWTGGLLSLGASIGLFALTSHIIVNGSNDGGAPPAAAIAAGVGANVLLLGALFWPHIFGPNRGDYFDFVNAVNRIKPEPPLRISE